MTRSLATRCATGEHGFNIGASRQCRRRPIAVRGKSTRLQSFSMNTALQRNRASSDLIGSISSPASNSTMAAHRNRRCAPPPARCEASRAEFPRRRRRGAQRLGGCRRAAAVEPTCLSPQGELWARPQAASTAAQSRAAQPRGTASSGGASLVPFLAPRKELGCRAETRRGLTQRENTTPNRSNPHTLNPRSGSRRSPG